MLPHSKTIPRMKLICGHWLAPCVFAACIELAKCVWRQRTRLANQTSSHQRALLWLSLAMERCSLKIPGNSYVIIVAATR